jgi:hypothetical protein
LGLFARFFASLAGFAFNPTLRALEVERVVRTSGYGSGEESISMTGPWRIGGIGSCGWVKGSSQSYQGSISEQYYDISITWARLRPPSREEWKDDLDTDM